MIFKKLFEQAESIIAREQAGSRSKDFERQYDIIRTRTWDRVTNEPDILNSLFVQAASYSVVRKYFKILYPEDIWRLDAHYGTRFFKAGQVPSLDYDAWVNAVVHWGNVLLSDEKLPPVDSLEALVSVLKDAKSKNWRSYTKKPRSRIVLSLATALPKTRSEILVNPNAFLDRLDVVSKSHPGKAYDCATKFSKGIIEMGNPLVCNFFKELGLLYYVKVDVHVGDFIGKVSFCKDFGKKEAFIMSWLLAREAEMEPFFLDKILYVGGKYLKPQLTELFRKHKAEYISEVNSLASEIARYQS